MPAVVVFSHTMPRVSGTTRPSTGRGRGRSLPLKPHALFPPTSAPALTQAEFAELPLSIQKKFFSSVERLRIAEHTAFVLTQGHQSERPLQVRRSRSIPANLNRVNRSTSRRRHRLRKPEAAAYDQLVSSTGAQWFLNLPDKVRRQQFSKEEQILFSARCDSLGGDIPDTPSPPVPSRPRHHESDLAHTPVRSKSVSSRGTTKSDQNIVVVEQPVPPKLYNTADMASCFDNSYSKRPCRPSTSKRTLSFSAISPRLSSTSIPPLLPSPFPQHGSSPHRRAVSSTPRGSESSANAFDPTAVHYSDPDARMKLREFLGSPQKFDEALEFGFPSTQEPSSPSTEDRNAQFLAPLTLTHDFHSFLRDDWLSFLDSDEEHDHDEGEMADNGSLPDTESPATPGDADDVFRNGRDLSPRMASFDSTLRPSSGSKHKPELLTSAFASGREMTLRMTLTRPDLRADEMKLYGWRAHGKDDPLALEALPISDDVNGGQSPFSTKYPRPPGRMRRFLSIVKRDGR